MNTALIFAGGTGQRMSSRAKPKQFLELHGKPIIVYTLEHFEMHYEIDDIVVVCVANWIHELNHLLRVHKFEKVSQIVKGGSGGNESIYNGLYAMQGVCQPNDIVLIHDGVRPLITEELISANIAAVIEYGSVITVESVTETVVRITNGGQITEVPPRPELYAAKAPQSFRYGLIWDLYQRAKSEGIPTVDSAHLCSLYNVEMHTVNSPPNNIKITAPADFYIFRALYEAIENQQILGI